MEEKTVRLPEPLIAKQYETGKRRLSCLKCDREFTSEGPVTRDGRFLGDRVCGRCNGENVRVFEPKRVRLVGTVRW